MVGHYNSLVVNFLRDPNFLFSAVKYHGYAFELLPKNTRKIKPS